MNEKLTPMMRQYKQLKEKYSDCFLFFRLGDFYEMFFEDAVACSRLLNITLTKRQDVPMCGVPFHAADSYLSRLTRLGKKVAICEQLSDPTLPGIVARDVVRVVTPGTTFDERILDQKSNNFIVSVVFGRMRSMRHSPELGRMRSMRHSPELGRTAGGKKEKIGLAACDITTGLLQVFALADLKELREEIFRLRPAECIVEAQEQELPGFLQQFEKLPVFPHQMWDEPYAFLTKKFGVKNLRAFGIEEMPEVVASAALVIHYLNETQKSEIAHLRPPHLVTRASEMILDETAIRNLELLTSLREGTREGSLISVLDMTKTPMGGRMLRQWLLHPLHGTSQIEERLDAAEEIKNSFELQSKLPEILGSVLDLERLLARLAVGTGNARDILGIAISLKTLEPVADTLMAAKSSLLQKVHDECANCSELKKMRDSVLATIVDAPPLSLREGGIIRDGIDSALDELRAISREGKGFIQRLQEEEIKKTGISSLKIRYNQIFGYYIEITKANLHLVPANYIRKQTMVNAERFITPELKEYEEKVLGAEAKMQQLEYELFMKIRERVTQSAQAIQKIAGFFGLLDTLLSLALVAAKNRYVRPLMHEHGAALLIKNGRHPVVEQLQSGQFVPNDVSLDEKKRIALITGPNMGGKSTYLRQTALICLLAHIGSFVPAESAEIPLIDRIFTRVGASDNLVRGQSTFMVEMQEAAQILHYATKNSLIILDEIGRGTSTYDGVSIAWAILEHIHDVIGARTIFATHYHELTSVAERLPGAVNLSVAVKEEKDGVVFLYRIVPGAINRSYGIEVARLAGLPHEVVEKAKTILSDLEEGVWDKAVSAQAKTEQQNPAQLEIFEAREHRAHSFLSSAQAEPDASRISGIASACGSRQCRSHRALAELKKIDVNQLTPIEALKKLDELKKL